MRVQDFVCEGMVCFAVAHFVRPCGDDDIAEASVGWQTPVFDRDLGSGDIFLRVLFDLFQIVRIASRRFLLEIPYKAVRHACREEIDRKIEAVENNLNHGNNEALECCGAGKVDEDHEVHALVLCFVEECFDPAVIAFDMTQGSEMLKETANHPRYCRNGFQYDRAMPVAFSEK